VAHKGGLLVQIVASRQFVLGWWHKKNPCHVQKKMLWTLGMLLDRTWAFPKDGFGLQNTQLSDKCTVEIPGSLSLFGI